MSARGFGRTRGSAAAPIPASAWSPLHSSEPVRCARLPSWRSAPPAPAIGDDRGVAKAVVGSATRVEDETDREVGARRRRSSTVVGSGAHLHLIAPPEPETIVDDRATGRPSGRQTKAMVILDRSRSGCCGRA